MSDYLINIRAHLDFSEAEKQLASLLSRKDSITIPLEIASGSDFKRTAENAGKNYQKNFYDGLRKGRQNSNVVNISDIINPKTDKELAQIRRQAEKIKNEFNPGNFDVKNLKADKFFSSYDGQQSKALQKAYELDDQHRTLQKNLSRGIEFGTYSDEEIVNTYKAATQVQKDLANQMKIVSAESAKTLGTMEQMADSNKIRRYMKENTRMSGEQRKNLEGIISKIDSIDNYTVKDRSDNMREFKTVRGQVEASGRTGRSLTDEIGRGFKQVGQFALTYGGIDQMVNTITQSVNDLKTIDSIMTEISKTSDMNSSELKALGGQSFESASDFGRTASDYLIAVQEMNRSGYYGTQGLDMARLSILGQAAGDMSKDVSNSYLLATDAAYGYKGSVEELNAVLDGQNMITNRNSVSMTDMAAATTRVASVAAQAGVAEDELSAMIGTIESRTKVGGDEVGTAMRAILVNLQNVGSAKIKDTLDKAGASMTEFSNGAEVLRNPIDILEDLAETYNSLSENDPLRAEILQNIGQKYHANKLSALLTGWEDYESMLVDYSQGAGSAAIEAEKSANNWEGSVNQLSNSFTDLIGNFADADFITGTVQGLNSIVKGADYLSELIGPLGTIGAIVGGMQSKNNTGFFQITTDEDGIERLTTGFGRLRQSKEDQIKADRDHAAQMEIDKVKLEELSVAIRDSEDINKDYVLSAQKRADILKDTSDAAKKWSGNLEKGYNVSDYLDEQELVYKASQNQIKTLGGSLKSLGKTFASVTGNILIDAVAGFAVQKGIEFASDAWDKYSNKQENAIETGQELISQYNTDQKTLRNSAKLIDEVGERFVDLRGKISSRGENLGLSSDEFNEYQDIVSSLSASFPELVSHYDSLGNPVMKAVSSVTELTDALQEQEQVIAQNTLNDMSGYEKAFNAKVNQTPTNFTQESGLLQQREKLQFLTNEINRGENISKYFGSKGQTISAGISNIVASIGSFLSGGDKFQEAFSNLTGIEKDITWFTSAVNPLSGKQFDEILGFQEYQDMISDTLIYEDIAKESGVSDDTLKLAKKNIETASEKDAAAIQAARENVNDHVLAYGEKIESELNASFDSVKPFIESSLKGDASNTSYNQLQDTTKEAINSIIGNMAFDTASASGFFEENGDLNASAIKKWGSGVVHALSNTGVQEQLDELFNLDSERGRMTMDEYEKKATRLMNNLSKKTGNVLTDAQMKNAIGYDETLADLEAKTKQLENMGVDSDYLSRLNQSDIETLFTISAEDNFSPTIDNCKKQLAEAKRAAEDLNATPLFDAWGEAQQSKNAGDKYNQMVTGLQQAKEAYDQGLTGTDDFKSFAKLISPTGAEGPLNFAENYSKAARYLTKDKSGVMNFLNDLSHTMNSSGEAMASFNKETGKWSFNVSNMDEAAQRTGIGQEMMMQIFGRARDYGIDNNFVSNQEEGVQRIMSLSEEMAQAEGELAELLTLGDYDTTYGKTRGNQTAIDEKKQEILNLRDAIRGTSDYMAEMSDNWQQEQIAERNAAKSAIDTLADERNRLLQDKSLSADERKYLIEGIDRQIEDLEQQYDIELTADYHVKAQEGSEEFEQLKAKAEESQAVLNEITGKTYRFDFDSSDVNDLSSQIETANEQLSQFRTEDGKINFDTPGAQESLTTLEALVMRREEMDSYKNSPVMQADEGINNTVDAMQEFIEAKDQFDTKMQMNNQGASNDMSTYTKNVESAMSAVKEALSTPGLESITKKLDFSSIDGLEASLRTLTDEELQTLGIKVDSSQLDDAESKKDNLENPVTTEIIANLENASGISALEGEIAGITEGESVTISATVNGQEQVTSLTDNLDDIPDNTQTTLRCEVENDQEFDTIQQKVDELNSQGKKITLERVGSDEVGDVLGEEVEVPVTIKLEESQFDELTKSLNGGEPLEIPAEIKPEKKTSSEVLEDTVDSLGSILDGPLEFSDKPVVEASKVEPVASDIDVDKPKTLTAEIEYESGEIPEPEPTEQKVEQVVESSGEVTEEPPTLEQIIQRILEGQEDISDEPETLQQTVTRVLEESGVALEDLDPVTQEIIRTLTGEEPSTDIPQAIQEIYRKLTGEEPPTEVAEAVQKITQSVDSSEVQTELPTATQNVQLNPIGEVATEAPQLNGVINYTANFDSVTVPKLSGDVNYTGTFNVGSPPSPLTGVVNYTGNFSGCTTAPEVSGVANFTLDTSPQTVPDSTGIANFMLGTSPTTVPPATGIANFVLGSYPVSVPSVTGVVNYVMGSVPSLSLTRTVANGTAHAFGTAFAGGDWRLPEDQTALTGELGTELLVRNGRWSLIGQHGAEFTSLKKGDIIFNHKQTEELFKHGYVTSGGGRGRMAQANGTAVARASSSTLSYVNGTIGGLAFADGNSALDDIIDKIDQFFDKIETRVNKLSKALDIYLKRAENAVSVGSKGRQLDKAEKTAKDLLAVNEKAVIEYRKTAEDVASRLGLSGTLKQQAEDGTVNVSELSEDDKKRVDTYSEWVEKIWEARENVEDLKEQLKEIAQIRLDNIQDAFEARRDITASKIDKIEAQLEYREITGNDQRLQGTQKALLVEQKELIQDQIRSLEKEHASYKDQLKKVKNTLGENSKEYKEAQAHLAELEAEIQENLVAYEEVKRAAQELVYTFKQYVVDKFKRASSLLDSIFEYMEARGDERTEQSYREQIKSNNNEITALIDAINAREKDLISYDVSSDLYQEAAQDIADMNNQILELATQNEEFIDQIREIKWTPFHDGITVMEQLVSEADRLRDLLNEENFVSKDGIITKEGMANILLLSQSIGQTEQQIADYKVALDKLEEERKNGVITQREYNEQSAEYIEIIQQSAKAVQDYREEILDLYRTQITNENELIQDNIDKQQELLDKEKDLYNWRKNVRDKTKNINNLKAQAAALEGSTNAVAQAKLAEIREQLALEQQEFDDEIYERELDLRADGYDKLAEDSQNALDTTLDALERNADFQESIVNSMLNNIKNSYKDAYGEIQDVISKTGIVMSDDLTNKINDLNKVIQNITNIQNGNFGASGNANDINTDKENGLTGGNNDYIGDLIEGSGTANGADDNAGSGSDIIKASSIKISPSKLAVVVGQKGKLTATVLPVNATDRGCKWKVKDSSIASIDKNGNVTGKKIGVTTVTADANDHRAGSDSIQVEVISEVSRILRDLKFQGANNHGGSKLNKWLKELDYGQVSQDQALTIAKHYGLTDIKTGADALNAKNSQRIIDKLKGRMVGSLIDKDLPDETRPESEWSTKSALTRHFSKNHKKRLNDAGAVKLAKILQIPVSDPNSWDNWTVAEKNKILDEVKRLGYSHGGVVRPGHYLPLGEIPGDELRRAISNNGDDGLITVKRGELILTPSQTNDFLTTVAASKRLLSENMATVDSARNITTNKTINPEINFDFTYQIGTLDSSTAPRLEKMRKDIVKDVTAALYKDARKLGLK